MAYLSVPQYFKLKNIQRSSNLSPLFMGNPRPINQMGLLVSKLALELRTPDSQSIALSNRLQFIREEKRKALKKKQEGLPESQSAYYTEKCS